MFVCSRSIWLIWCWFLRRGENRESVEIQPVYRPPLPSEKSIFTERRGVCTQARRKTSRSKGENQQQTQPTYGVDAEIWTRATLVGGECSHHRATPALLETWTCAQVDFVKRWPNQNGPWWKPWRNRKDYCYQHWLVSVQTSETSGQAAKSDWMSEHKEGNKTAAFILRIKGLICLQRKIFNTVPGCPRAARARI